MDRNYSAVESLTSNLLKNLKNVLLIMTFPIFCLSVSARAGSYVCPRWLNLSCAHKIPIFLLWRRSHSYGRLRSLSTPKTFIRPAHAQMLRRTSNSVLSNWWHVIPRKDRNSVQFRGCTMVLKYFKQMKQALEDIWGAYKSYFHNNLHIIIRYCIILLYLIS